MSQRRAAVKYRSGNEAEIAALATWTTIAVDLGFAKAERSCGLAWKALDGQGGDEVLGLGKCIEAVCSLLQRLDEAALILEVPLSGMFNTEGNPREQGDFELRDAGERTAQRYWYSGPGAATCLAAIFFCRALPARLLGMLEPSGGATRSSIPQASPGCLRGSVRWWHPADPRRALARCLLRGHQRRSRPIGEYARYVARPRKWRTGKGDQFSANLFWARSSN